MHKEIEVRAGQGNVKFIQTRTESKLSKLSPTRSQPNKMRAEQSSLLSWKLTRPLHKILTSK